MRKGKIITVIYIKWIYVYVESFIRDVLHVTWFILWPTATCRNLHVCKIHLQYIFLYTNIIKNYMCWYECISKLGLFWKQLSHFSFIMFFSSLSCFYTFTSNKPSCMFFLLYSYFFHFILFICSFVWF